MNEDEWGSVPALRAEIERLRRELAAATAAPTIDDVKTAPKKKKHWLH